MRSKIKKLLPQKLASLVERKDKIRLAGYEFAGHDIRDDIVSKYDYRGPLLDIYVRGAPQLVHKWHHYLPLYDQYFSKWRGRPVRFLEIGVSKGGSISMWRRYFGEDAIIFGIDIDPACAAYDGVNGQVRIGSQDDPDFLRRVVQEMGGVDIILDDGSHIMQHIKSSFHVLFPLLEVGGTYMIEDLHTAYWRVFGGGMRKKANFFNLVREWIDDMHTWYHSYGTKDENIARWCSGIHIHDSICVIDKDRVFAPTHSQVINRS